MLISSADVSLTSVAQLVAAKYDELLKLEQKCYELSNAREMEHVRATDVSQLRQWYFFFSAVVLFSCISFPSSENSKNSTN